MTKESIPMKEVITRVCMGHIPVTEYPPTITWKDGTAYNDFLIDGKDIHVDLEDVHLQD